MQLLVRIKQRREFALLTLLFAGCTIYDLYYVTAVGKINLSEHVPFFLPAVILILMGIVHVIDKHVP